MGISTKHSFNILNNIRKIIFLRKLCWNFDVFLQNRSKTWTQNPVFLYFRTLNPNPNPELGFWKAWNPNPNQMWQILETHKPNQPLFCRGFASLVFLCSINLNWAATMTNRRKKTKFSHFIYFFFFVFSFFWQ